MPSCENIYALSIVTVLTACLFSIIKKSAKMSVFLCENRKNALAAGGVSPPDSRLCPPQLPNPGCATEQKEWTQSITGKASD